MLVCACMCVYAHVCVCAHACLCLCVCVRMLGCHHLEFQFLVAHDEGSCYEIYCMLRYS